MKSLGAAILIACAFPCAVVAGNTLTWIRGSSVKVEQMIGDCDYTSQAATSQCKPATSRTSTRAKLLGTDLGASFGSQGSLIFLFGDSFGPAEDYFASDTMASSTSSDPALFLAFAYVKIDAGRRRTPDPAGYAPPCPVQHRVRRHPDGSETRKLLLGE
ncbi:MAG: hypothetical protein QOK37_4604 [Thermoanaerobaculia bacterium]|jgi:hypothetical protein|nr:hypothetical protein [Thermoanaerobaculia bacterium]